MISWRTGHMWGGSGHKWEGWEHRSGVVGTNEEPAYIVCDAEDAIKGADEETLPYSK